jgi:hypothetical protein
LHGFSPDAFTISSIAAGFLWFHRSCATLLSNLGAITLAAGSSLLLYIFMRRSRYFGNTTPLFCALILMVLVTTGVSSSPWLWALPFLLTFIGGVFADAFEGPRGKWALAAAGSIVVLQVILCVLSLPGLL